ncbi:MAG: MATE family efflux transporter [Prevotella sp.]
MRGLSDNYVFLTQKPVRRVILTMAMPTILTMLVSSLYNMADTFFVGQLDTQSTAAVGIVFPLMFTIQAFGFFFGHGSGNYISRELGARRRDNAGKMASTGFVYSLGTGTLIAAVGLMMPERLSGWLGSTPTIMPYTESYLRIILLGAPFMTASLTLNNQMRMQGNATYAMYGIVSGAVLNVVLDPIFIFVMDMGVDGAALATIVGQVVGFAVLMVMSRKQDNIRVSLSRFCPSPAFVKEIIYGGSPSLSRQGLGCVAVLMLNVAAATYGDAAIAAMSIVSRIAMLAMSVVVGLGQGFQPMCGFCYGAGLYDRLREGFRFTVITGTIFLTLFCIVGMYFSEEAILLFRDDAEVVTIGSATLCWQLAVYPLNVFVMASNMMLQSIRKPLRANILASARHGLFFIPLIIVLPYWFGLTGVEMCQAWSDVLSFLLALPVVHSAFADMKRQNAQTTGE